MTNLLEEALYVVRMLPEDEQERAAQALIAFARERSEYDREVDQIAGIRHGMGQPPDLQGR